MLNNQNILLLIATLVALYLLFNRENFVGNQYCEKTPGTTCDLGNRPNRCGPKCCRCACNAESC